jgi:hypothetical protein
MSDENKIKQLLEAFHNGDTTMEEEALLMSFFNDKNLDMQWHTHRDLFNVLYNSSETSLPEGFSERLEGVIDKHIMDTSLQKNERQNKKIFFHSKVAKLYTIISSAAAVILLCIGLFLFSDKNYQSQFVTDTYTDPEEAAVVAEQILSYVSTKLNLGFLPLETVKKNIDKTSELLNEKLNK